MNREDTTLGQQEPTLVKNEPLLDVMQKCIGCITDHCGHLSARKRMRAASPDINQFIASEARKSTTPPPLLLHWGQNKLPC